MGKVAVVGSSRLDMAKAAGPLLNELTKLPQGTTVLLRRPAHREEAIGAFELVCAQIVTALGLGGPSWYEPDVEEYAGRAATFERDIRMAHDADQVLAFFPENETMTGGSGHVVEKFHDIGKPSNCFTVNTDGSYQWAGGMEAPV